MWSEIAQVGSENGEPYLTLQLPIHQELSFYKATNAIKFEPESLISMKIPFFLVNKTICIDHCVSAGIIGLEIRDFPQPFFLP